MRGEPRNTKSHVIKVFLGFLFALLLHFSAKAADVLFENQPGNKITAREAAKRAREGQPTYKCESKRMGPNINPVKVPNSKASYHTAIGEPSENASQALVDGKVVFGCKAVYMDKSSGRLRTQAADIDLLQ